MGTNAEKIQIRFAKPGEKQETRNVWEACFDDKPEFTDMFFSQIYDNKNALVLLYNDKIVSMLNILSKEIYIYGNKVKGSYISGVATLPEYRKQGFAALLMKESTRVMKNRGIIIATLMPSNHDFYRKFDWQTFCFIKSCNMQKEKDNSIKKNTFRKADRDKDKALLDSIRKKNTGNRRIFIGRTIKNWQHVLTDVEIDNANMFIYEKENKAKAYLIYSVNEETVHISEAGWTDDLDILEIIKFVLSNNQNVKIDLPQDIDLDNLITDNVFNIKAKEIKTDIKELMMARIIDVKSVLDIVTQSITTQSSAAKSISSDKVVLNITDKTAPWNEGTYIISGGKAINETYDKNKTCTKNKTNEIIKMNDIRINLDIKEFTTAIAGISNLLYNENFSQSINFEKLCDTKLSPAFSAEYF